MIAAVFALLVVVVMRLQEEEGERARRPGPWVHDPAFNERVESQEWEREQGRE
jgi:hypothetical protein